MGSENGIAYLKCESYRKIEVGVIYISAHLKSAHLNKLFLASTPFQEENRQLTMHA